MISTRADRLTRLPDYALTVVSLAIVTLANLKRTIPALLTYVTLLGLFAGFVVWNGGVVLGDKSNHIATLHLPQMLYLQPYILFFSWPLILPMALRTLTSLIQGRLNFSVPSITRAFFILGTLTNLVMAIIHYNTIVHPFTLADNRHYVFYVFRLLTRTEEVKYLAAPVYVLATYVVIQALGGPKPAAVKTDKKGKKVASPAVTGCMSSFVIIWLITTALSLITAPLVEPRYCIIPWIMWRLHVPTGAVEEASAEAPKWWKAAYSVLLETAWFMAIAIGTGYMFLYKGFIWPQEPGKIQRFMW